MSFRFLIDNAGHLKTAKVWFIEGFLEQGIVKEGSIGTIKENNEVKIVNVKNVALVTSNEVGNGRLTLSIEEPNFPITFLKKGMIIESITHNCEKRAIL